MFYLLLCSSTCSELAPTTALLHSGAATNPDLPPVPGSNIFAIAAMLATVDISPAKDDQVKVIEFTPEFTTGLTVVGQQQEQSTNK
ncbi:hypothetical protein M405DRAFT_938907 [Rhizopogon salebrosus TDB-379]|nr:hypothetical protein M405DRAFT_938907 [Rhizopogon salebrosus TDB-379]